MAVDTENKRRSVAFVLPVPDNTIAQADRQQITWIYSGILAAVAATDLIMTVVKLRFKRHIRNDLDYQNKIRTDLNPKNKILTDLDLEG